MATLKSRSSKVPKDTYSAMNLELSQRYKIIICPAVLSYSSERTGRVVKFEIFLAKSQLINLLS